MEDAFAIVLFVVVAVAFVAAVWALVTSRSSYDEIGSGGLITSPPETTTTAAERDAEIRQMLEARNAIRTARGEEAHDVDAELRALTGADDPELREEVRSIRGVAKAFGRRMVLQAVDLELDVRGIVRVEGANGAGKSTLLRLLAGVTRPTRGRVEADGPRAFVPERFRATGALRAGELLRLAARETGRPARRRDARLASRRRDARPGRRGARRRRPPRAADGVAVAGAGAAGRARGGAGAAGGDRDPRRAVHGARRRRRGGARGRADRTGARRARDRRRP
jgi:hypothetical protein